MNQDEILAQIETIFQEATQLLAQRGHQYGGAQVDDYFPHGDFSYHQMCHLKLLRALSQVRLEESPLDSLLDLLNYTAFWIAYTKLKEVK